MVEIFAPTVSNNFNRTVDVLACVCVPRWRPACGYGWMPSISLYYLLPSSRQSTLEGMPYIININLPEKCQPGGIAFTLPGELFLPEKSSFSSSFSWRKITTSTQTLMMTKMCAVKVKDGIPWLMPISLVSSTASQWRITTLLYSAGQCWTGNSSHKDKFIGNVEKMGARFISESEEHPDPAVTASPTSGPTDTDDVWCLLTNTDRVHEDEETVRLPYLQACFIPPSWTWSSRFCHWFSSMNPAKKTSTTLFNFPKEKREVDFNITCNVCKSCTTTPSIHILQQPEDPLVIRNQWRTGWGPALTMVGMGGYYTTILFLPLQCGLSFKNSVALCANHSPNSSSLSIVSLLPAHMPT